MAHSSVALLLLLLLGLALLRQHRISSPCHRCRHCCRRCSSSRTVRVVVMVPVVVVVLLLHLLLLLRTLPLFEGSLLGGRPRVALLPLLRPPLLIRLAPLLPLLAEGGSRQEIYQRAVTHGLREQERLTRQQWRRVSGRRRWSAEDAVWARIGRRSVRIRLREPCAPREWRGELLLTALKLQRRPGRL